MQSIDFVLTGDPAVARMTATQALEARKFRLTWSDDWSGLAERGSKVGNAFAGAFAQYFKVGVRVMSGAEGQSTVRLEKLSSGWMGGAIGAARTTKNMNGLREDLEAAFRTQGVLVGVNEM